MEIEEQKKKVTTYFDESKDWQGGLYQSEDSYFARVIKRRKAYAFDMLYALPDLKRGKALDVGFGSGVYLDELLNMGFDCSGMDISPEMLEACRNRLAAEERAGRLHLLLADVEHIPFEDGSFDLVICIGVLGYLLRDEQALAELKRVVKPGGYLLVNLTNMYSLSDADYVLRKRLKSLFLGRSVEEQAGQVADYAMQNQWMLKNRKFHFKSYNLWKYQRLVCTPNFKLIDSMTYGYEFRLLRRTKIVPQRFLFGIELFLEKLFRTVPIPYIRYSGWVYTGIFRRQA